MRSVGQMSGTPRGQTPVFVIENADPAALGGDIDTPGARVVGQHIGSFADTVAVNHGSIGQIDGDHRGVGFAAHKHHLIRAVQCLAMRVIATGRGNAFCHSETDRIDDGEGGVPGAV